MISNRLPNDFDPDEPEMPPHELQLLVGSLLDESISDQDFKGLQSQLQASASAREAYRNLVELHLALHETLSEPAVSIAPDRHAWTQVVALRKVYVPLLIASCALSIAVASVLFFPMKETPIAWTGSEVDLALELRSGDRVVASANHSNEITFRNGVKVSLSQGADLEILDDKKVRLHTGQAYVDVGEQGKGFTVLTEAANIVDLGTVFGVGTNSPSETEVLVFDGVVDIATNSRRNLARKVLVSGQAERYDKSGTGERIPTVWSSSLSSEWSTAPDDRSSPVASITDNVPGDSNAKFYMVVSGGFREDALVYVDRKYEWNGLDKRGIPQELIGADYIRTFNDDKHRKDIDITLTLSREADVYILVDQRYLIPDWLSEDFVDTGWKLGIDLGLSHRPGEVKAPPLGTDIERFLGSGPGNSVDVPVNVWKLKHSSRHQVHLGPNGEKSHQFDNAINEAGSMYGIVIAPKNRTSD
ncbi:FecR domain-containing protein [Bremerella sp.]|uniref:FecR domain-containing protein n=1 Tax=Bremerella sp. TaxID=2795602 RepID=UPI003918EC5E